MQVFKARDYLLEEYLTWWLCQNASQSGVKVPSHTHGLSWTPKWVTDSPFKTKDIKHLRFWSSSSPHFFFLLLFLCSCVVILKTVEFLTCNIFCIWIAGSSNVNCRKCLTISRKSSLMTLSALWKIWNFLHIWNKLCRNFAEHFWMIWTWRTSDSNRTAPQATQRMSQSIYWKPSLENVLSHEKLQ